LAAALISDDDSLGSSCRFAKRNFSSWQNKSRPRHSNDNGLAESKNRTVIRKLIGYGYIAPQHAGRINEFYQQPLNLYVNFHRPCAQAEVTIDTKGKQKQVYWKWAAPWEVFVRMPQAADYLKKGTIWNTGTTRSTRERYRLSPAHANRRAADTIQFHPARED
jgi:hypothetical protein